MRHTPTECYHIFQNIMVLKINFRDESLHQVSTLKRQNDDLLMNTVHLEGQLNKSKQKISGSEEQLRKLEQKVSVSDVSIANQVRFPIQLTHLQ